MDKKYLGEYYIPNRLIKVSTNTWGSLDYTIEQDYRPYLKWDVKQFLDSQNENEWSIVIGAPFGVGKTSFATDLASTSNESEFVTACDQSHSHTLKEYLPLAT
jgi:hypothetical protein